VQADTIELLSTKGKFTTERAVILAEAIDMGIEKSQLVTVPVMDARLAETNSRISQLATRMESGFAAVNARIDSNFLALNARIDGVTASLNARIDGTAASLSARIDSTTATLNARMDSVDLKIKLIIALIVGQTALSPVGMHALSSLRQALSTLVH
jgi:hypothetical protein